MPAAVLARRRPLTRYADGIHLDFARDFHYVKEVGGKVTRAPFTSLFTFTGDNKSMYRGGSGLLIASLTNTPRIEYDYGGNVLGLLVEGARTNLFLRSQEIDNASWSKVRASITADDTAAPDGTTTADKLVEDNTASNSHFVRQDVSVTSGTVYTVTVWAKADERPNIQIGFGTENSAFADTSAHFTLSGDGTATTVAGSPSATITRYANGWYRCKASATAAATATGVFRIFLHNGTGTSYSGDGASGAYLWGAQLEAGSFASSYIPTTTGSVARAADVCTRTVGSEYAEASGTFVVEAVCGSNSADAALVSFDDGTTAERHYLFQRSTTSVRLQETDGGVSQATITVSSITAGAAFKAGYAYALNDLALVLDGGTPGTDTGATMPTITTVRLGTRNGNGDPLFGHIRRLSYWPTRQSNAFLQWKTAA